MCIKEKIPKIPIIISCIPVLVAVIFAICFFCLNNNKETTTEPTTDYIEEIITEKNEENTYDEKTTEKETNKEDVLKYLEEKYDCKFEIVKEDSTVYTAVVPDANGSSEKIIASFVVSPVEHIDITFIAGKKEVTHPSLTSPSPVTIEFFDTYYETVKGRVINKLVGDDKYTVPEYSSVYHVSQYVFQTLNEINAELEAYGIKVDATTCSAELTFIKEKDIKTLKFTKLDIDEISDIIEENLFIEEN